MRYPNKKVKATLFEDLKLLAKVLSQESERFTGKFLGESISLHLLPKKHTRSVSHSAQNKFPLMWRVINLQCLTQSLRGREFFQEMYD